MVKIKIPITNCPRSNVSVANRFQTATINCLSINAVRGPWTRVQSAQSVDRGPGYNSRNPWTVDPDTRPQTITSELAITSYKVVLNLRSVVKVRLSVYHHQSVSIHCSMKASPNFLHNSLSAAFLIQTCPPNCAISSIHLIFSRLLERF